MQVLLEAGLVVPAQAESGSSDPEESTQTTVRDWVPPPQLSLHGRQAPVTHLADTHSCVLQLRTPEGCAAVQ